MKDARQSGVVLQQLIYAGLDALRAAVPLDLCAYLQLVDSSQPQLYLRHPDLSSMDASDAFQLFGALRDALEGPVDNQDPLSGYSSVVVTSSTSGFRGLWVAGRRGDPFDDLEREVLERLLAAISEAHRLVASVGEPEVERELLEISVDVGDGVVQAGVAVSIAGSRHAGRAEADSPLRAVALAVLDAVGDSTKLRHVGEDDVSGERAVVVVVETPSGERGVGSALVDSDHLTATAFATLAAVTQAGKSR